VAADDIQELARQCGFEAAGVAPASPSSDAGAFLDWVAAGHAGGMGYLTDHRAAVRQDPRLILPSARSIVCVAKVYNQPVRIPHIAQYAVTDDYHEVMKRGLEQLAAKLRDVYGDFEYRAVVDTAPLLERSYARLAGLGWIGRNTCLINEKLGSWVYLGELLTSLPLEGGVPAPDRCGTCTRCIEACPTAAIRPGGLRTVLDATRCISYYTIEHRGDIPQDWRESLSEWVFGCDICQDVCPWNRRAPETHDPSLASAIEGAPLDELAALSAEEFRHRFRGTPLWRTKYGGFLRNVAVAMGNSGEPRYLPVLERLAGSEDTVVASHARWAIEHIEDKNRSV
jgi:epoxyqueuosine reductase